MQPQLPHKPHLLKITPPLASSFVVKGDLIVPDNPWHFHPEIELLYCIKGKGTNFVGNSIRGIEEGEILLFGKNLPHTRQRDTEYYRQHPEERPETVVVQFREDFLGAGFFGLDEFLPVRELLYKALRGLRFLGHTREVLASKLCDLTTLAGSRRLLGLLEVLDVMAHSAEFEYLNHAGYADTLFDKPLEKINKVYKYTIENFRNPIALSDIAALTNLSKPAFCRYFRQHTRKSYVRHLTEVRVGYACKLLSEGDLDISQVCYESGFNNLSNFHKQFRKIAGMTPNEYKNKTRLL